jgi:hypothetical protein
MEYQNMGRQTEYIKLNNKVFAKYTLIYSLRVQHVPVGYISNINLLKDKNQLVFNNLENKIQEHNLIFVDSFFLDLLADLTLEVFINKVRSFNEYLESKPKINLPRIDHDYLKYKFFNFINLLLYSEIASNRVYRGDLKNHKVYCLKNKLNTLEFFSIYEQTSLQLKLLEELKLEIDSKKSGIFNSELKLVLKISY